MWLPVYRYFGFFKNILNSRWSDECIGFITMIVFYYYVWVCHLVLKILNNASILNFDSGNKLVVVGSLKGQKLKNRKFP